MRRRAAVDPQLAALRVNLTLPSTTLRVGPLVLNPLEQLIGARVVDLLEPLMVGPVQHSFSSVGAAIEIYPLALPDGEGALVPLGSLGEVGFFNEHRVLILTVPTLSVPFIVPGLGSALLGPPERVQSPDGRSRAVNLRVQLQPGARAAFQLGGLGEIGIEAV